MVFYTKANCSSRGKVSVLVNVQRTCLSVSGRSKWISKCLIMKAKQGCFVCLLLRSHNHHTITSKSIIILAYSRCSNIMDFLCILVMRHTTEKLYMVMECVCIQTMIENCICTRFHLSL